jgi:hypothetical protein
MTWKWICDFGLPGPDRGEGGKYLIVPPGYNGPLPEGGYFDRPLGHCAGFLFRPLLSSKQTIQAGRCNCKKIAQDISLCARKYGSSVGNYLNGKGVLGQLSKSVAPRFVDGTGKVMNTIPPADYTYFELLMKLFKRKPAGAVDAEIAGQLAAIGIVKGKPFNPDARMKKILTDAAAVG